MAHNSTGAAPSQPPRARPRPGRPCRGSLARRNAALTRRARKKRKKRYGAARRAPSEGGFFRILRFFRNTEVPSLLLRSYRHARRRGRAGLVRPNGSSAPSAKLPCKEVRRNRRPRWPTSCAAGANLCRAMVGAAEALAPRQGRGEHHCHTVRVEHVTVQAGGQAIVGAVAAPAPPPRASAAHFWHPARLCRACWRN